MSLLQQELYYMKPKDKEIRNNQTNMFPKYSSKYLFFLLFLFLVVISSCNKRSLKKQTVVKHSVSKSILQEVLNNNLQYETLRIKGKCSFREGKSQIQFAYRIHIEKEKKIWVSLSGFGIEAVRVYIQGDSAAFFNRLEQTYWKGSNSELMQKFGIEGDIRVIESILIGNFFQNQVDKIIQENNETQFLSSLNQIPLLFAISSEQKMKKIDVNDTKKGWKSELHYDNFQVFYNKLVPLKMNIIVKEPKNVTVSLEHKEIEVNPKDLKFNFQIPEDYRLIDLKFGE